MTETLLQFDGNKDDMKCVWDTSYSLNYIFSETKLEVVALKLTPDLLEAEAIK